MGGLAPTKSDEIYAYLSSDAIGATTLKEFKSLDFSIHKQVCMKLPPVKAEKYNTEVKKMNPSYVYEVVDHPPIDGCWLFALLGPVPPFCFFGWGEIKDLPRSHHK